MKLFGLQKDRGLGDTVARFTKFCRLPRWAARWMPVWLHERITPELRERFSIERFAHWFAVDILKLPHCGCPNRQKRLNSVCSYLPATITIGMPHRDDLEGVWATVQTLRDEIREAGLQKVAEILVVDQSPPKNGQSKLKVYCERVTQSGVRCRYVVADKVQGSAAAKNQVFINAKPPEVDGDTDAVKNERAARHWVVCVDCHVHPEKGTVRKIYDFAKKNPNNVNLHYGCLQFDDDSSKAFTDFSCWRGDGGIWTAKTPHIGNDLLLGTWRVDPRARKKNAKPFEIEACGGWFVICRKAAWIGFHPLLRGHGGEEWYIAEAFRQMGRKVLCLPFARASHRFIRTSPVNYGGDELTIRNCVICWKSLGYDPDRLRTAFTWPQQKTRPDGTKYLEPLRDPGWVNSIIDETLAELKDYEDRVNSGRAKRANRALKDQPGIQESMAFREGKVLEAFYGESEVARHLPVLRSLASKVPHVLEYPAKDKSSTWAVLMAQPKSLTRMGGGCGKVPPELTKYAGVTEIKTACTGGSCSKDPSQGGLLFVTSGKDGDVWELADAHKKQVNHFIAVHGDPDEEKARKWATDNPDWRLIASTAIDGGFAIFQRTTSDIQWSLDNVAFPPPKAEPLAAEELPDTDGLLVVENFGP